ncbi:uncharacterized protein L969DRAFT_100612 [Mixia osmundae IAM 14324]|uniref:Ribosomal protein S8 n=1 Tax=Mixia osmundae (strain CBS 9802 / IAM 14324 / JCM 22182 / KY 12970) TaxID=764103 RepID=G7DV81_MIXOS|nr:uncharacterized protein L969DRAFT_100612 [Mixia osmundae IAM 14324]KEI42085.1 hypothetical protein L969DRAFT_100612 [Mixia osmundae IAM 14324]GAA94491.1 hypothetical protein E5Q_01143 [Mixia osmundae IAM 14324]
MASVTNTSLPAILCTTLRNASRARLRCVQLMKSKQNLKIAQILLKHGFVSNVHYGTATSPVPADANGAPIAAQRIWVHLKYRNDRPVLGDLQLISKPSRRITVSTQELHRLLTGRRAQYVPPIGMGEIAIVRTGDGQLLEAREALTANAAGELVARIGPDI